MKEGKEKEFETLFNKYYGEHYELVSKSDAFKNNLFGEGKAARGAESVLGNYIAISLDEMSLYASKELKHMDFFKGHHAGGTKEERLIDISIYNK